ncbi:MAG: glucosamine-6-phosphate deaminase [Bacteroidetes bacterium]|nr:glucosamine-6-phosphate deaminase [Bacteroidota bacterium]
MTFIQSHYDYEGLSDFAAYVVSNQIKYKPTALIGFATGSTPVGLYKRLVKRYDEGDISFDQLTTVNLDEYIGLPDGHEQSYSAFMQHHLFDHVNIRPESIHFPSADSEPSNFDLMIQQKGGIDLQILGLGTNGHIGFNEPGSSFDSLTRVVDLASSTIQDNARFFDHIDDVPTQAVTMGIKTIMNARKILLLASGASKADAVFSCLSGPETEDVPGSCLQSHPELTVLLDDEANKYYVDSMI